VEIGKIGPLTRIPALVLDDGDVLSSTGHASLIKIGRTL